MLLSHPNLRTKNEHNTCLEVGCAPTSADAGELDDSGTYKYEGNENHWDSLCIGSSQKTAGCIIYPLFSKQQSPSKPDIHDGSKKHTQFIQNAATRH